MYDAKTYTHLLGMPGFSDQQLTVHFGLYEGYVKNTNLLLQSLNTLNEQPTVGPDYAEMKRRFGWEFNGMRLHELYFENMSKEAKGRDTESPLMKQIQAQYGSFDRWQKDFVQTGALRGIGWAVLTYDPQGKQLHNTWINEHDGGHLAGSVPILIMDVFEHAFVFDYGMKRADYIAAFMNAIHWEEVQQRFDRVQ